MPPSAVRLSVIVPGYNATDAQWTRCVRSVLAATGPADEVILVDDGSRDGAPIIDTFGCRCRVVHKPNGGLASARNRGLDAARGEFVTFVDSDDEVTADVYERALDELRRDDADVCLFGVRTLWPDLRLAQDAVPAPGPLGVLDTPAVSRLCGRCLFNYASNKVYRRAFLERHGLRFAVEGMPCEDVVFNLEAVLHGARWCATDCLGYRYYRQGLTLLSSYKPTIRAGLSLCRETWARLRARDPESWDPALDRYLTSDAGLARAEWANLWRPGAPGGLRAKWAFLRANRRFFPGPLPLHVLRRALFAFARRHCYFRWIRRWRMRRLYRHVVRT